MTQADVFQTEVNPITGELDVDSLPQDMGVYAVFDEDQKLQYVGLSRDIRKSVTNHADAIGIQEAGDLISSVRCLAMPSSSKEALKETWERWITEHMDGGGEIPPGNLPESAPGADPRWRSRAGQAKPSLNLAGVRGITTPAEATAAVKKAVESYPVVLFMKGTPVMPQCGFSAKAVGMLREIGAPYETVNVLDEDSNPGVRDAVKQFSNWPTIPQLFVNGKLLGGADIMTEMFESGQLKEAVKNGGTEGGSTASSSSSGAAASVGTVELIEDPGRPVASLLSQTLSDNFKLEMLRIVDDSSQHEGDAGALEMGLTSESHFTVEIVSPEFDGMTPVERQKKVFGALKDVMPRIHALSLVTRTPQEVSR